MGLETLKDIEDVDYSIPRVLTPENCKDFNYKKGEEPRILDEKYCMSANSKVLRAMAIEWIKSFNDIPKDNDKYYYEFCIKCSKWVSDCIHFGTIFDSSKILFDSSEVFAMQCILKHVFNLE